MPSLWMTIVVALLIGGDARADWPTPPASSDGSPATSAEEGMSAGD